MNGPIEALNSVIDGDSIDAEVELIRVRFAVSMMIKALVEIAGFDGDPMTPVANSAKKSAIARAALARIGGAE